MPVDKTTYLVNKCQDIDINDISCTFYLCCGVLNCNGGRKADGYKIPEEILNLTNDDVI